MQTAKHSIPIVYFGFSQYSIFTQYTVTLFHANLSNLVKGTGGAPYCLFLSP